MTTKDQEREALKKIRKIVADLGEGSYLEITFAGIFEQAEQNITDDSAMNYADMWEGALIRLDNVKNEYKELKKANDDLQAELDKYKTWYEKKSDRVDELNAEISEAADDIGQYIDQIHAAKNENEALKAEIITLKAKLYDLITA